LKAIFSPLKVLISPVKTFKEVAQDPQIKGLILVLTLLLATTAITQYVSALKISLIINNQPPISLLASNLFTEYMLSTLVYIALIFFLNWVIYAGALFILVKAFGGDGEPWGPFFMLVGHVFSVYIVRMGLTALLISTLPNLPLTVTAWPPTSEDDYNAYIDQVNALWSPTLALKLMPFMIWIVYVWFMMLGAVAVHVSKEIAWGKAVLVSFGAFLINFMLSSFLGLMF
jgi:hypothetical protein